MKVDILVVTNIVVPIIVAIITGLFTSRKYKKEIDILKLSHQHEKEKLDIGYKHQLELINEKTKAEIGQDFSNKLFDEVMKNPDVKRSLHQGASQGIKGRKRNNRRK